MSLNKLFTALFLMLCVTGFCMSNINARSYDDHFENPIDGQFYFNLSGSYEIHYSITYYDINGVPMPNYSENTGSSHVRGDFSRYYASAVNNGAKTVTINAEPWGYGGQRELYSGSITPIYLNFWGWCALGGSPRCAVSFTDISGSMSKHMVYFT